MRAARRRLGPAALAGMLALALALPAAAARDDLILVSRTSGGVASDGDSDTSAISADGRLVAFASHAANLSPDDTNLNTSVFVRDVAVGTITLASRATGAAGASATGAADTAAISGDGRRVAFSSASANLSADDDDRYLNVFVRDLGAGTTTLASRADGPAGVGTDAHAERPALSGDGNLVAFDSAGTNLSAEDADPVRDVFVRDLAAGTTRLVSRATGAGGAGGDLESYEPAISADGRRVAFASLAKNLSPDDGDAVLDVFVRDLADGTTTLVSRAPGAAGAGGDGDSTRPSISADGRYVAFLSKARNLSGDDEDATVDVYVRDLAAGTTTLVSRATGAAGAAGDGTAFSRPSISADGTLVAFESSAENLSEDDRKGTDVFVRDLAAGTTAFVSRASGPAGAAGDAGSLNPSLSGDGRFVSFDSDAANLSALDDRFSDIFVRDLSPAVVAGGGGAGGGPGVVTVRCGGLRATIVGTPGRDVLRGTPRRDVIAALGGADRVYGLGGNDLICLGAGNDRAAGGPGADRILGGPGRDLLIGGAGRDRLLGGPGRDRVRP